MRLPDHIPVLVVCLFALGAFAQSSPSSPDYLDSIKKQLVQTRSELSEDHRLIEELQKQVAALTQKLQPEANSDSTRAPAQEPTVAAADQDPTFLAAKIAELHQDKVESASKYPVKLSGLVLFNTYLNNGSLDTQDVPALAFPRTPGTANGSLGALMSQTIIGVDVRGPQLFGANSSGSLEVDFAGGYPPTSFGDTAGILRLRTAEVRLEWKSSSLKIGQASPFFSPLSPTSYATVQEPALSWAGNLWVWTPQIEAEHRLRLNPDSSLILQGGLLDSLTEEEPQFQGRAATAGEQSRSPAFAGRVALDRWSATRLPFVIGVGAYRARQRYGLNTDVRSWTVNTDFKLSLAHLFEVSGEWYRGQAVGGLGGGIWSSVIFAAADDQPSLVHPLHSIGGWTQVKWTPVSRFEVNGAIGQDENYGNDLRFFPIPYSEYGFTVLKKNRAEFVNVVYKPNSFLLFATEYRRLRTVQADGEAASGAQINVAAGVRF